MYGKTYNNSTRSPNEQWEIANEILKGSNIVYTQSQRDVNPNAISAFIGDVFFIAIVRQKMLVDCDEDFLADLFELTEQFVYESDQFQFTTFMCSQNWWKKFDDIDINLCSNVTGISEGYSNGLCQNFARIGTQRIETHYNYTFPMYYPSIIVMEPNGETENEEDYVDTLQPLLLSNNDYNKDLIIVFSKELYIAEYDKYIKLPPLVSIPIPMLSPLPSRMPGVYRHFEVILRGNTTWNFWNDCAPKSYYQTFGEHGQIRQLTPNKRPPSRMSRLGLEHDNKKRIGQAIWPGRRQWINGIDRYSPALSVPTMVSPGTPVFVTDSPEFPGYSPTMGKRTRNSPYMMINGPNYSQLQQVLDDSLKNFLPESQHMLQTSNTPTMLGSSSSRLLPQRSRSVGPQTATQSQLHLPASKRYQQDASRTVQFNTKNYNS